MSEHGLPFHVRTFYFDLNMVSLAKESKRG